MSCVCALSRSRLRGGLKAGTQELGRKLYTGDSAGGVLAFQAPRSDRLHDLGRRPHRRDRPRWVFLTLSGLSGGGESRAGRRASRPALAVASSSEGPLVGATSGARSSTARTQLSRLGRPRIRPRRGRCRRPRGPLSRARCRARSRARSRSSLRPTSRNTKLVASTNPTPIRAIASSCPRVPLKMTAPAPPASTSRAAAPKDRIRERLVIVIRTLSTLTAEQAGLFITRR